VGEANKAPLPPPPPPTSAAAPPPPSTDDEESDVETHDDGSGAKKPPKAKKSKRLVGFIKGTTKAGVQSVLGVDRLKATVGSEPAKTRLGVVQPNSGKSGAAAITNKSADGPASFHARHHGKKGRLVISTSATTPCVSFERLSDSPLKQPEPIFSIAIDDIRELRKIGGLGWKGKLVVGWALGTEVADGLEIVDVHGKREKITAIQRRDEVFNRLIALSDKHHWESW